MRTQMQAYLNSLKPALPEAPEAEPAPEPEPAAE